MLLGTWSSNHKHYGGDSLGTWSSNHKHYGGDSPVNQMSGQCATMVEQEKMNAHVMELCSTLRSCTNFMQSSNTLRTLISFTQLYVELIFFMQLYAALRGANIHYAALRSFMQFYSALHS
jgi:hypothetical protein